MQNLNKIQRAFLRRKEGRLERLIRGGLLYQSDAVQVLCDIKDTVAMVLRRMSTSVEKEIVVLAVLIYMVTL